MSDFYYVFHTLDRGVVKSCEEEEWKQKEANLDPVVIESRVGRYLVETRFRSAARLHSGIVERPKPFHIMVTSDAGEFVLPQSSFPHRIIYDRVGSVEEAKLVHFALVRFLEHLTKVAAVSTMTRRAVHNNYWDPDDDSPAPESEMGECRVVDDRPAPDS